MKLPGPTVAPEGRHIAQVRQCIALTTTAAVTGTQEGPPRAPGHMHGSFSHSWTLGPAPSNPAVLSSDAQRRRTGLR